MGRQTGRQTHIDRLANKDVDRRTDGQMSVQRTFNREVGTDHADFIQLEPATVSIVKLDPDLPFLDLLILRDWKYSET